MYNVSQASESSWEILSSPWPLKNRVLGVEETNCKCEAEEIMFKKAKCNKNHIVLNLNWKYKYKLTFL